MKRKQVNTLYHKSLGWYSASAIYYRILYHTYLLLLYTCVDQYTFGCIGTIFSLIYLFVEYGDGGYSETIAPFFNKSAQSPQKLKLFIVRQWHLTILWFIVISAGTTYFLARNNWYCLSYGLPIALICIAEITQKIIKKFLQLSWHYKLVACIENITITVFLTLLILQWYFVHFYSTHIIIWYMAAATVVNVTIFICIFIYWIQKSNRNVVHHNNSQEGGGYPSYKILLWTRFLALCNKGVAWVYSSNALVPIIAYATGVETVAYIKLFGSLMHTLLIIVEHSYGINTEVLLTHVPNHTDTSIHVSKIPYYSKFLKLIGLSICIVNSIGFLYLWHTKNQVVSYISIIILLYCMLLASKTILFPIEKLYFIQLKAFFFCIAKTACMVFSFFILQWMAHSSIITILLLLLCARVLFLYCIWHASMIYTFILRAYNALLSLRGIPHASKK